MQKRTEWKRTVLAAALAVCAAAGMVLAAEPGEGGERLAALREAGTGASVTVYPFLLGEQAVPEVGPVVAVLLEKAGVEEVGADDTVFRPVEGAGIDEIAAAFGEFIRESGIEHRYALYGEFLGTRKEGIREIRAFLVDREGNVVWMDNQKAGDEAFDRADPKHPMQCCLFVAERLQETMALPEVPESAQQEPGKFEREMTRKSGLPDEAEFAAIEKRSEQFKGEAADAGIVIYPVRIRGELNREQAQKLAEMLGEAGFRKVRVGETELPIEVEPARNEQKMLWALARSFQDHVRAHPPEDDYALYADYLVSSNGTNVGAVHFVLCDREGNWVVVDFQNSHHKDFKKVAPDSVDDCSRLAARRMARYIR